jgi:hypothetical protein
VDQVAELMSLLDILAPRCAYRLRHGRWCDHRTYRFRDWVDEVDFADISHGRIVSDVDLDADFPPDVGFDQGVMIDCGMAKLFTCQRCGYIETTLGHPMRDWIRERWRGWRKAGITLALGALALGIGVTLLLEWMIGWR